MFVASEALREKSRDQSFIDDIASLRLEFSPIDGASVRQLLEKGSATPKDVIAHYNAIVKANN